MNQSSSFFERANNWLQNSITIRMVVIGILILLLLIPVSMVKELISERSYRSQEAISEVSSKWGQHQTFSGPVLTVPYLKTNRTLIKSKSDSTEEDEYRISKSQHYAHFLPNKLAIDGVAEQEVRKRGIFNVVLYKADLAVSGNFSAPDFSSWNMSDCEIQWDRAFVSLGLTDLRSVQSTIALDWQEKNIPMEPGIPTEQVFSNGISCFVPLSKDTSGTIPFALTTKFNGSQSLFFTPLGKITDVRLKSAWPNPMFDGAFLPDRDSGEKPNYDNGFDERWNILDLNRSFPQKFIGTAPAFKGSEFGVRLILPLDHYDKSMRSAKYAVLFIALTFLVFFFVQILNRVRIHPLQYLLVGLSLCVFYTLLLSISEHIGFSKAYFASSLAIISLITLYAGAVFKSKRLTAILGLILVVLYGFIYIILQSQDHALLLGSIGLFLTLALVMYLSRKVDWYNLQMNVNEQS